MFVPGGFALILLLIWLGNRGIAGAFIYPLRVLFNHLNGAGRPVFIALCLASLMFFCLVLFLSKDKRNQRLTFASAVFLLTALYAAFNYWPPLFPDLAKGWHELDSVQSETSRYYLAVYESDSDGDFFSLYECDRSGFICREPQAQVNNARGSQWTLDARLQVNVNTVRVVDNGATLYERSGE